MKLSIVIVSYNVKYFLEQCLVSINEAAREIEHEVIVIDNASNDNSTEHITSRFPGIKWIASDVNHGFSKANNIAFKMAKGEYVLMLNPDTIVTSQAIKQCVEFMDRHDNVGAAGVMMLNRNGSFALESRRGFVTPWVSICKALRLSHKYPKSRLFGHYYMSYLPEDEENPIEMLSGACMFIRREALEKVGYLDEDFFMYWEDSDLSYRILKLGYKNYYLPYPIMHYKGKSSIKSKLKYRYWLYYSLQIFFKKHNPLYFILSYIPLKVIVAILKLRIHYINPLIHYKAAGEGDKQERFLIVGNKDELGKILPILERNELDKGHRFLELNENELLVEEIKKFQQKCEYVLFCPTSVSYDTMIHTLKQLSGFGFKIATYLPGSDVIIADDVIM